MPPPLARRTGPAATGTGSRQTGLGTAQTYALVAPAAIAEADVDRPRLRVSEFRPVIKNTLRGFCVIELPSGLRIHDVAVHQRNGTEWASFPAVPQLEGGVHRAVDGKPQYKRVLEWTTRALTDRFSAAVCAALRREYPGSLDGETV